MAPVTPGTRPEIAAKIAGVAHDTFVSGMSTAFTVAGIVAVAGRRGRPVHQARRERGGGGGRGPHLIRVNSVLRRAPSARSGGAFTYPDDLGTHVPGNRGAVASPRFR